VARDRGDLPYAGPRKPRARLIDPYKTYLHRAGGLEAWYNAFLARIQKTEEDMTALDIIAMAACYSPQPELTPFPFRLPFEPSDLRTAP
jgi:hypothetical protein